MVNLLRRQQAKHLGQCYLDRIGVLKRRQRHCPALLDSGVEIQVHFRALPTPLVVIETMFLIAQRRASALRPVDLDELTATDSYRV
jgi:ABC-type histidine transport system ATPase subunit